MGNFFDQFDSGTAGGSPPPQNFFDQFDKPAETTLEGVAKSAGSGLVKGAAGVATTPQTIHDIMEDAAGWAARNTVGRAISAVKSGGKDWSVTEPQPVQTAVDRLPSLPRQGDVVRAVENNVTGPLYQPQTTAEKMVGTAAEFVPAAIAAPGNVVRNAIQYGVAPGVASETAGQYAAKHGLNETAARIIAGGGAGGVAALASRPGPAVRYLAPSVAGVTDQQLAQAQALMRQGQQMGVPLSVPEAVQQASGGASGLGKAQRVVEGSAGGGPIMSQFYAGRPAQVENAGRAAMGELTGGAPLMDASETGLRVQRASEDALNTVRGAINRAADPYYRLSERTPIPQTTHDVMMDDPRFAMALERVRNNEFKNADVAHLPDNSVGVYDAVKKELAEIGENASVPATGTASRQVAANASDMQQTVRNTAINADRMGGVSPYETALNIGEQGRRQILEPMQASTTGALSKTPDLRSQIQTAFDTAPLAGTEHQIREAVQRVAQRDPQAAENLVRQHAEQTFNEATQRLQGGENQYGGANFAARIVGNPQQAANLEAAVRALPNGDQRWTGFRRFLDVMEATGKRPRMGSNTSQDTQTLRELESSGLSTTAKKGALAPTQIFKTLAEGYDRYRLGRGTAELARIFTGGPEMIDELRRLSRLPTGSQQAATAAARILVQVGANRDRLYVSPNNVSENAQ